MNHATTTAALYRQAEALFRDYPLAVQPSADPDFSWLQSMALGVAKPIRGMSFFVLHTLRGTPPAFRLSAWREDQAVIIRPGGLAAEGAGGMRDEVHGILAQAVPVPRDATVLGWCDRRTVTALLPFWTRYAPDNPVPSWHVMPHAGVPEAQWPPFTGEPQLGHWLWRHLRDGRIADLTGAVAATAGTVFWAGTWDTLGADSCVVTQRVSIPGGRYLDPGTYAYSEVLRDPAKAAALDEAVRQARRDDLGLHLASLAA